MTLNTALGTGTPLKRDELKAEGPLSDLEKSLIRTLLYFDIFHHPLKDDEMHIYCRDVASGRREVYDCLETLEEKKLLNRLGGYNLLQHGMKTIQKRRAGNRLSNQYLERAHKISNFISGFPFVRGVMISGSLSKGYMEKGSDIDFFIITAKGRLWLCRSLLAAFRKILPRPLKKYFCMNYFVDEASLAIPDRNLFTATEITFIIPTYGAGIYESLIEANRWIREYYPNKNFETDLDEDDGFHPFKKMLEFICRGSLGEKLDSSLFRFMLKRWKKRYNDFDESAFDLNIRTRKNVSKQHEKGHQTIILDKYREQLRQYELLHQLELGDD